MSALVTEGFISSIRTPADLHEALDALHTAVIDNFPETYAAPYEDLLSQAMDRCEAAPGWETV